MQSADRYFTAGEVRLRYRDEGAGAALAWLHGWTLDLGIWEPQCAEFRGAMRVLRHDRRGFGCSGGRPDPGADAEDFRALLEHLQVARVTLVGMSQGARAALAFALAHRERVAGLVLDGPPNPAEDAATAEEISLEDYRTLIRQSGIAAFREAWRRHPLMRLHSTDPDLRALRDGALARYLGHDLLQEPAPAPRMDDSALARLQLPVLVLNGELDTPARRRAGDELCRRIPGAERAFVPRAGHLANLDNPGGYNELIRSFLRRQSRAAA